MKCTMPKVPFVQGSDTSEDAAERLRTRLLVGNAWIDLASRPDGANVKEVERYLRIDNSGPSARQGELANSARVLFKHPALRRENCGVYFLVEGITAEAAKARYAAWCASDDAKSKKEVESARRKALLQAMQNYASRYAGTDNFAEQLAALEDLGKECRRQLLGSTD